MNKALSVKDKVKLAYKALDDKKAADITILDIGSLTVVADYFLIASADNIRQTAALCDNVQEMLEAEGITPRHIEGEQSATWILMDYGDIIIHIFDTENRLFYDLERIWKDGRKIVNIDEL